MGRYYQKCEFDETERRSSSKDSCVFGTKKWKSVVLTIEDELGKTLIEWPEYKQCRDLDEVFHGDLQNEKQKMINSSATFESGIVNLRQILWISQSLNKRQTLIVNLAQLLRFNTVKTKQRSDGFVKQMNHPCQ